MQHRHCWHILKQRLNRGLHDLEEGLRKQPDPEDQDDQRDKRDDLPHVHVEQLLIFVFIQRAEIKRKVKL